MKHRVPYTLGFFQYQVWLDLRSNELLEGFGGFVSRKTYVVRLKDRTFQVKANRALNRYVFIGYL